MDKMSADVVMNDVMDLQNNQPPMDLKMPSLKRDKPWHYSHPTKRDLEAMRKERARVLLSLIPSDKRKKIGLDLSLIPKRLQTLNTEKYGSTGQLATFPYLFWNVVKSDTYRSVWWSTDGTAVVIHEMMFIAEILERDASSQIFGAKNIKNFYRQLNQYGFTRPKFDQENHRNHSMDITAKQVKVFANPCFQKGCGHLLAQMKRRVVNKVETSPVTEEESFGASGNGCALSDQVVISTSHRHATPSPSLVRGLEKPSLLLAPEQVGLALRKPSVLDQLEALLSRAQQPAMNKGMALLAPSLVLPILLAALLNPGFLQMDNTTSATASD